MLTEPQIQRYARQVLLRDVGERGQQALGAVGVAVELPHDVASAAAAYLRAGGTEVQLASEGAPAWARTAPLLASAPVDRLQALAAPGAPERGGVVLGAQGAAQVLWSIGEDACPGCLRGATRGLAPPAQENFASVQLGTLVALLVQRRALGLAPAIEGLRVDASGALSTLVAPACTHRPPLVPEPVLAELVAHLTAALPDEGCAVLLGREEAVRLVPMQNAQAAHHARDPETFPRSARHAFSLDPRAWLALLRKVDRTGERVLAIAHSHPDGSRRFSAEDRRWAAPGGQPLLPGVAHLVVAFENGQPRGGCWAVWADGDFLETDCPLPRRT